LLCSQLNDVTRVAFVLGLLAVITKSQTTDYNTHRTWTPNTTHACYS